MVLGRDRLILDLPKKTCGDVDREIGVNSCHAWQLPYSGKFSLVQTFAKLSAL